ncbi:MAG: glycosyltransferase family 4 protein [Syntrophomonadaceae bacterium]|nr:glycosyltransferase family 4 protein [Syntrophomonadaceae bacterium]
MKIALLAPIAWRTPPRHYGPWEAIVSMLAEGLVCEGMTVTLFATGDSLTNGQLEAICPTPYEETPEIDAKVWECLHVAHLFEQASRFDIIHNHYDFLPLSYSRLVKTPMVTTIHGFSSPKILPVYQKYNQTGHYVSISIADRYPQLDYCANVYHGIDLKLFSFNDNPDDYLLYFGRIHPDKGTYDAIQIARRLGIKLIMAGIIQDHDYYQAKVAPYLDQNVVYAGSVGPEPRNTLLRGALALLHPIYFDEPFGLSVIEAMACGTPVVAYNRGSMPEVIKDGETGFLVGTLEEAVAAVKDITRLNRSTCRRWIEEQFSKERMVEDYLRVYRTILQ